MGRRPKSAEVRARFFRARASGATLRQAAAAAGVSRTGDHLHLSTADDGRGIPRPYVSGLGITSMRKRVEALGGRFAIGPVLACARVSRHS